MGPHHNPCSARTLRNFVIFSPLLCCVAVLETKVREEYELLMKQNRNSTISGKDIYITHRCQVPQSCTDDSVSEVLASEEAAPFSFYLSCFLHSLWGYVSLT